MILEIISIITITGISISYILKTTYDNIEINEYVELWSDL